MLIAVEEPRLRPIKGGWAASGDGWAVHGATQEEALQKFRRAVEQYREIISRPYWYEVLQGTAEPIRPVNQGHTGG